MKKYKIILFAFLITYLSTPTSAQVSSKDEALFIKSIKLAKKSKFKKAIKKIEPVVERNPQNEVAWNNYIQYCYFDWANSPSIQRNFSITTSSDSVVTDDEQREINDAVRFLSYTLGHTEEEIKLHRVLVNASLNVRYSEMSWIVSRNIYVDGKIRVDTNLLIRSIEAYREGELEFKRGNYNDAAKLYQEALDIEPRFYKARLYLGDCYYSLKEYSRAVEIFEETKNRFPRLLEPAKYYVDALDGLGQNDKAKEACMEAILRFPDGGMFSRLADYYENENKTFDDHWMRRKHHPNQVYTSISELHGYEEELPEYWKYYREAKDSVIVFADSKGILQRNSVTDYQTLEGYCWDYMLRKADKDIEELEFARKMQAEGMLEPYVLISLFHVDLYDQFIYYTENNRLNCINFLNSLAE
jgi:tetratricopeptide (TPR) repeat protein